VKINLLKVSGLNEIAPSRHYGAGAFMQFEQKGLNVASLWNVFQHGLKVTYMMQRYTKFCSYLQAERTRKRNYRDSTELWFIFGRDYGTRFALSLVDQSSPERTREESLSITSFRFSIYQSISEIFAVEVWSCPKSLRILHDFAPKIFWGTSPPPVFWDLNYKTEPTSDHVAKFHGDRPRELKDLALKERTSAVKHKTAEYYRTGRRNKLYRIYRVVEVL